MPVGVYGKLLAFTWIAVSALGNGIEAQAQQTAPAQNVQPPDASPSKPTNPTVLHTVDPEFSGLARRKRISGTCTLSLTVDEKGLPQDVVVKQSVAEGLPPKMHKAAVSLDEKAVEAVRQYIFNPATMDGKPVAVKIEVRVNFQLF